MKKVCLNLVKFRISVVGWYVTGIEYGEVCKVM
jgi:hypothetical protein